MPLSDARGTPDSRQTTASAASSMSFASVRSRAKRASSSAVESRLEPVEGLALTASGAGARARGGTPVAATTDEDGIAVLRFGDWGAVDLALARGDVTERWLVTQDRVAVNGGKSTVNPLRLIVGAGRSGGMPMYNLAITRVEKGGKIDN